MAQDVKSWLETLDLGRYAETFAENEIDLDALSYLNEEDLKEMGVALGPRRKILAALKDPDFAPADSAEPPPSRRDDRFKGAEAERRQLTVMFVDMVGSTEVAGRLDPEELRDLMTGYQTSVAEVVSGFEGHVAKFMGDGVLCYFGWPRAHEDDAERAVRAALSILEKIKTLRGGSIEVRVGIATGLVVVGDLVGQGAAQEEAVVGETPNLAARLQGIAAPGQIVLPEATRRLVGDFFTLSDLGLKDIKGMSEPVPVFAVEGERMTETRFEAHRGDSLTTMVGRDQELALILNRWDMAQQGEGQMVLLTGEAGIGKSRITGAVIESLEGTEYLRLSYQCSSYHSDSALQPAIRQLVLAAGIEASDAPGAKLDKLETLLGKAEKDIRQSAPLIAQLLGIGAAAEARYGKHQMPPQERREATLEALIRQLLGLSERTPVLFVLEDAHWIDPTTLELVERALDRISHARVLFLVTARPVFKHEFTTQTILTRLALNRLGRRQIGSIVGRITGGKSVPPDLIAEIAEKTDGVPLFVEELTKSMLELGILREEGDGYVFDSSLDRQVIPSSLHDSLMARLDRLQPVKEVAQTAACIGREFTEDVLARISPLDETALHEALEKLLAAELIFKRGAPPHVIYSFKHALVQDAAHESLLRSRRQKIHAKLVEVLQADESAAPELVAYHAMEASLFENAIELWREAGTRAMAQPAYIEAVSHLKAALAAIDKLDDKAAWNEVKLKILLQLAQAQMIVEGYLSESALQSFQEARELLDATEDLNLRGAVYYGIWIGPYLRAQHAEGLELTNVFVKEANQEKAPLQLLISHRMKGANLLAMGRSPEALESLEVSFKAYGLLGELDFAKLIAQDPAVQIRCYRYLALWMTGFPDQAVALAEEANELSRRGGHTNTICYNNFHDAVLALWARDTQRLKAANDETLRLATEHGMILWRLYGALNDDLLRCHLGEEGALDHMKESYKNYHEAGCRLWLTFYKAEEAKELLRMSRLEEAGEALHVALDFSKSASEAWADAELHRVEGLLHKQRGDLLAAEESLQRALSIAREQQARILELRAACSLAEMRRDADKPGEGKALLAPIHDWFTEGFDTADLKDARALLESL